MKSNTVNPMQHGTPGEVLDATGAIKSYPIRSLLFIVSSITFIFLVALAFMGLTHGEHWTLFVVGITISLVVMLATLLSLIGKVY